MNSQDRKWVVVFFMAVISCLTACGTQSRWQKQYDLGIQ